MHDAYTTSAVGTGRDDMNDKLPCLDLLEATPAILRGLMSEISDEDARWKPAPDRFSIAEVLAHLSHSEGHCYRARVDRFMAEAKCAFEAMMTMKRIDVAAIEAARRG